MIMTVLAKRSCRLCNTPKDVANQIINSTLRYISCAFIYQKLLCIVLGLVLIFKPLKPILGIPFELCGSFTKFGRKM